MSIERLERKGGVVWRVRWRDERGRNRSKVLGRKRDAEAFDAAPPPRARCRAVTLWRVCWGNGRAEGVT
jgi:hypothetical protein